MSRSLPPLTWFRSFEAAARNLSFTAAAAELGLTQSAISQQVRSLETRLGAQLFIRKPRGLILTDDGRKLLPKVGTSLDQLTEATSAFDIGGEEGVLTVATSISVARWIIAPHLPALIEEHPDLRIRMLGTIWPDEFKASLADIEVRFGSDVQVGKGAERLLPDALVALASPDIDGPLHSQTLIETVGASEGWADLARAAGLNDLPKPRLYVDSYGAALDLAANGAGVALSSSLLAADAVAEGLLRRFVPESLPSSDGYFLAVNKPSSAAKHFVDWILRLTGGGDIRS